MALIFLPQQQEIELALSAGPEHLRLDATVYVFGKRGYEKIRSGKNGFTCMVNPKTMAISKTLFPPHYMIYAPDITHADIGINMDAYKKHPSLPLVYAGYSGGARTAYIIVMAAEDKGHSH